MRGFLNAVRYSPVLYPVTACYVVAVVMMMVVTMLGLPIGYGVLGLGLVALSIVVAATRWELRETRRQLGLHEGENNP